ncbi:glycine oxidase maturase GoxB [Aquibaculum sediminis]|uniref:glycine oxidase maturase GoxB n=1 Tax=Aquibaculum sediminis TaxID=3231907 RepID=UPI0034550DCC
MTARHPVAVIGGGIAGAATCVSLARQGCSPLWLALPAEEEAQAFGESLGPGATPILKALGLEDLLATGAHRSANASFSAWGSDRLTARHAAFQAGLSGYVLDRPRFEADLLARAAAVAERLPHRLGSAQREGQVWRLRLSSGASCTASAVVDASGRAAVFARQHSRLLRQDRLIAAAALLRQRDLSVEPTRATLIEALPDGWLYAALLPDEALSLAYFTDPDLMPAGISRDPRVLATVLEQSRHIARWIADAGFVLERPPRLYSAGTTRLAGPIGYDSGLPPWMAVGDAAAAFDPLSSHGMTTALWGGWKAGETVAAALTGDRSKLERYAAALTEGIADFDRQQARFYAAETRFPDSRFWAARKSN